MKNSCIFITNRWLNHPIRSCKVLKCVLQLFHNSWDISNTTVWYIWMCFRYNQKSDIWAVGCVLYEMLTLRKVFDASVSMFQSSMYFVPFVKIQFRYSIWIILKQLDDLPNTINKTVGCLIGVNGHRMVNPKNCCRYLQIDWSIRQSKHVGIVVVLKHIT